MLNLCLISITASHYRKRIYQLMDEQLNCSFIFGKDNSSVKRLETSIFRQSIDVDNKYIGRSNLYYQPGLASKTKNFDIIISDLSILCLSSWYIMLLAKFRGQKVYTWGHWWYGREGVGKKLLKRLYDKLSDGNLVYGNYACELMKKNGFDPKKLHVIHNSLDYDEQLVLRAQIKSNDCFSLHFGNANAVLCFIGRLTRVKNLDLVLQAIFELKKKGDVYNLVIIADGEERRSLELLASQLDIADQVWFYGACYDERTNAELIYNTDLCVAPGNIGLTAMHAMMFGCPCMSHNDFPWQMPEFEAIIPDKTGNFFERNNVSSLANAIEEWFRLHGNEREQIRINCFKEVDENWNPHKQIEIIKKLVGYGI